MIQKIRTIYYDELEHEHRFMMSLICAELIILVILKVWPDLPPQERVFPVYDSDEVVFIEKSIVTRQSTAPASPPKPQVPVPVPDDEVIEEEIDFPDFEDILSKFDADGEDGLAKVGGEGEIVGSPQRPPGLVRIVEPTIPDAAKEADIKAQVIVTFLVGKKGEVEDMYISEIRVYEGKRYKVVDQIGYGIMEAVIRAATKWRFTPARDDGQPVRTYVENSFNIGF